MKIDNIYIENYKSVENVIIDNFYQNDRAFNLLIGINESGKTSILQAINTIFGAELEYSKTVYKPNNGKDISVKMTLLLDEQINKDLKKKSEEFFEAKKIQIKELPNISKIKLYFCKSKTSTEHGHYYFVNDDWYDSDELKNVKDEHDSFLWKEVIEDELPQIIYWAYNDEFLLPSTINLNDIINGTRKNKPIENIFKLADLDVHNLGDFKNPTDRKSVQRKLQTAVNKHFKSVWKSFEANVEINIEIEQTGVCTCLIEDKNNKNYFYDSSDRSDGFRQFLSFILSVSCETVTKDIENAVILLDEPELHLHPSGIEFLRDRLINISQNNVVVCATHSPFMVDKHTPESHIIVRKIKGGKTQIERQTPDTLLLTDDVMRTGFGLNYWKELLPEFIVLVEGYSDKIILNKVFQKLGRREIFVQSCKGSELPRMYRYAMLDNLKFAVIIDNDSGGESIKTNISHVAQELHVDVKNVFYLKDILNSLPEKCTMEDVLEKEDVSIFIEEYDESKTFTENVKNKSKQEQECIKTQISDSYQYNNQPKMARFIENFCKFKEGVCEG